MRKANYSPFWALVVAIVLGLCGRAESGQTRNVTVRDDGTVVVRPGVYPHALRNALKGFRPDTRPEKNFRHPFATVTRCYIRWRDIERRESDGVDRIRQYCDRRWAGVEKYNLKVIPRVYLDWDSKPGNEYWPEDLQSGDYSSDRFKARVVRLVKRLGQCWDNDPRVAWVQMGIVGYWGEHHHPEPDAEMQKLLGDAFTQAFRHKHVLVRHPWHFTGYQFGIHWDSWAHVQQMKSHGAAIARLNAQTGRWKYKPIEGETAYDWGRYYEQPGSDPNDTLRDPGHRDHLVNVIRWLHGTALGWVANYDATDPAVQAGADKVQQALGYRFLLEEVTYPATVQPGELLTVQFRVRNVGSAPFYYKWPVELSLLSPQTRRPIWSTVLQQVDIRRWLPGDDWDLDRRTYRQPPKSYTERDAVRLPTDLPRGRYILSLAICDPDSGIPSVRFAMRQYFRGGRHPVGYLGVGVPNQHPGLDASLFDDPGADWPHRDD